MSSSKPGKKIPIKDLPFIGGISFLLSLLWVIQLFNPITQLWAQVSVAVLVLIWYGLAAFVWLQPKNLDLERVSETKRE